MLSEREAALKSEQKQVKTLYQNLIACLQRVVETAR